MRNIGQCLFFSWCNIDLSSPETKLYSCWPNASKNQLYPTDKSAVCIVTKKANVFFFIGPTKTCSQRQLHHTRYILSDSLIDWEGIKNLHSKQQRNYPDNRNYFTHHFTLRISKLNIDSDKKSLNWIVIYQKSLFVK